MKLDQLCASCFDFGVDKDKDNNLFSIVRKVPLFILVQVMHENFICPGAYTSVVLINHSLVVIRLISICNPVLVWSSVEDIDIILSV